MEEKTYTKEEVEFLTRIRPGEWAFIVIHDYGYDGKELKYISMNADKAVEEAVKLNKDLEDSDFLQYSFYFVAACRLDADLDFSVLVKKEGKLKKKEFPYTTENLNYIVIYGPSM